MANSIYGKPESAIVFSDGGTPDFSPQSVASGAGRISAQHDRGTGSKPTIYRWQARTRANAAPTVGGVVRVYLVTGDDSSTMIPGTLGTADAAVSSEDKLRNAQLIGIIVMDEASTSVDFVANGLVEIRSRYVSVAYWNASGVTLHATGSNHEVILTAYSDEIQ